MHPRGGRSHAGAHALPSVDQCLARSGLRGTGAVQFIPQERRWILDGDLVSAD